MTVAAATLPQMVAAQRAAEKFAKASHDFVQGNPAPAVQQARVSNADLQVLVTALQAALTPLAAA